MTRGWLEQLAPTAITAKTPARLSHEPTDDPHLLFRHIFAFNGLENICPGFNRFVD
jgi:hypothetical protein